MKLNVDTLVASESVIIGDNNYYLGIWAHKTFHTCRIIISNIHTNGFC